MQDDNGGGLLSSDDNREGVRSTKKFRFSNFQLDTYSKTRLVSPEFRVEKFGFRRKKSRPHPPCGRPTTTPPVVILHFGCFFSTTQRKFSKKNKKNKKRSKKNSRAFFLRPGIIMGTQKITQQNPKAGKQENRPQKHQKQPKSAIFSPKSAIFSPKTWHF